MCAIPYRSPVDSCLSDVLAQHPIQQLTNGSGTITLSLPQSISTASSPSFSTISCTGPPVSARGMAYFALNRALVSTGLPALGTLLMGTGDLPTLGTIVGTTNQVTVTPDLGSLTLSLPQSIATTSEVKFAKVSLDATFTMAASADASTAAVNFHTDSRIQFERSNNTLNFYVNSMYPVFVVGTAYATATVPLASLAAISQLRLGSTFINAPGTTTRTITLPEPSKNCEFVITQGDQEITGIKTMKSQLNAEVGVQFGNLLIDPYQSVMNRYEEYTWATSFTGPWTTAPGVNIYYTRIGRIVHVHTIADVTAT